MRQMVLGPAREFCVHAAAPVSGLAVFNALVMPLQQAWPELANTYEAPGCQGTKISSERFFAFFPPVGVQHGWQSAACSDLISHAGAAMWLHQTLIEVLSSFS